MNCHECQNLLQRRLDREVVDEERLREHIAACADCRAMLTASARLLEGLRQLPAEKPPLGFSQRLTAGVLRDREERRRRLVRWGVGLAVAASVLFVLILNQQGPDSGDGKGKELVVKDGPAPSVTPGLHVTFDEVRRAVGDLTDRMTKSTTENAQKIVTAAALADKGPAAKNTDGPLTAYAQSMKSAGQGVSEGLEPVMRSGRQAVNYFFRTIPTTKGKTGF